MASQPDKALCLLALDGGGIRGLSELCILREIMHRIKYKLKLDRDPLPAEYFGLIGGTSTGELIALLLGRLRFSAAQAVDFYCALSKEVFGYRQGYLKDGAFSAARLEEAIKGCIEKGLGNSHQDDTM